MTDSFLQTSKKVAITKKKSGSSKLFRREAYAAWLFISPALIGLVCLILGPMIASLYLSFTRYNILNPAHFIGFGNYISLFKDPLFFKSVINTFFITVIGVPLNTLVALVLALLLNQKLRGISVYRTIFYLPAVTPAVASAILWYWILNSQWGVLNQVLGFIGIHGPNWLGDPNWSKPAIILMQVFSVGPGMIILLAGLQGIPNHLYEAAEIDGASKWKTLLKITIPLLSPAIFFNMVIGTISSMQVFTESFVLTQGGPLNSTLFYVYYLFNNAFAYFKMGYASSMAWILFLVIAIMTFLQFRLSRIWVYYETGGER